MNKYAKQTLLVLALVIPLTGCMAQVAPVVIPDSKEVKAIPDKPGWFEISGGHLKELYEQQRLLVDSLEKCQKKLEDKCE